MVCNFKTPGFQTQVVSFEGLGGLRKHWGTMISSHGGTVNGSGIITQDTPDQLLSSL